MTLDEIMEELQELRKERDANRKLVQIGKVLRYGRNASGARWHGVDCAEDGSLDIPEGTPVYILVPKG